MPGRGRSPRSEELEAKIRRLMTELATYPPAGPTAWQFRETRRRLSREIEFAFQAWDIAREFETHPKWIFDQATDDACEGA